MRDCLYGLVSQCFIVRAPPFNILRMIAMRTKFILPMRLDWIAMLLMIGFFGFFAQVSNIYNSITICN